MPSHQHADQPTDVGTVDALISQAQELRGKVDAVRRDAHPEAVDHRSRWQRALCDLAVHHLQNVGEHLGQLREEIAPPRYDDGIGETAARDRTNEAAEEHFPASMPTGSKTSKDRALAHLGRAGSAEWHLLTDEVIWSDEMFQIFGRDPADGALHLDELPSYLFADDQAIVAAMVTACLVDGSPIDGEFRIVQPDGRVRTVHLVGEPVHGQDGSTVSMWAVIRDVSDLRRSQRAARETQDSLRRSRQAARTERRMAVELHEAVLPPWLGPVSFPQGGPRVLDLAARYLPADTNSLIGGDWYDAMELLDGSALLTVGDLTGHGVSATSGMAMLLGALRGMALSGLEPGTMMRRVNQILDRSTHPTLGSAVCCRFDPEDRTLTWARAGYPAPLLFRDGDARALKAPPGALLGASGEARYGQRTEQLLPGDVLILYTEGLVPRHGTNTAAGTRHMLDLAPRIRQARDAQECVRAIAERFLTPERDDDGCVLAARVC